MKSPSRIVFFVIIYVSTSLHVTPIFSHIPSIGNCNHKICVKIKSISDDELSEFSKATSVVDRSFLLTGFCLEICLALSSMYKPHYALLGLLFPIAATFTCILELILKRRKERVVLRWRGRLRWFYHPPPHDTLAPSVNAFAHTVQYVYLHCRAESPTNLSFLAVIFLICLAGSTSIRNIRSLIDLETLEHTALISILICFAITLFMYDKKFLRVPETFLL
ncbi:hypothetical protein DVH24_021669 [Malus domestica]|uniref:Uncharacterized protein n=1 Tax=Malus domestica TaxID=3750 RepID=A0A498JY32_MALDO|nr:hypothetical protein DVH24_021669 [Malus domestica]